MQRNAKRTAIVLLLEVAIVKVVVVYEVDDDDGGMIYRRCSFPWFRCRSLLFSNDGLKKIELGVQAFVCRPTKCRSSSRPLWSVWDIECDNWRAMDVSLRFGWGKIASASHFIPLTHYSHGRRTDSANRIRYVIRSQSPTSVRLHVVRLLKTPKATDSHLEENQRPASE